MQAREYDVAIAGGGLAGGLTALALAQIDPGLRIALIEAGPQPGGRHRWSWFASDLDPAGTALLDQFSPTRWDDGYAVRFPGLTRRLPTPYRSLASDGFAATLAQLLPAGTIRANAPVQALDAGSVTLADGSVLTAKSVIDARGIADAYALTGGWQVFLGRTIRTDAPHGVQHPTIMDAGVEQVDGYRFVYVLPLNADTIFVEDTYYADAPRLDRAALGARIEAYAAANGWHGRMIEQETGALPVVTGGDFAAFSGAQAQPGVTRLGVRGGFFHPLTSYSLPIAAATAIEVARLVRGDYAGSALATTIAARAADHWRGGAFYRTLGAMLMQAGDPGERWRVFERFYRLPEALIERFYAGRSTLADKARVLAGKPPVPVIGALKALTAPGRRLGEAA
jgi:lycopene beta-cyclase